MVKQAEKVMREAAKFEGSVISYSGKTQESDFYFYIQFEGSVISYSGKMMLTTAEVIGFQLSNENWITPN